MATNTKLKSSARVSNVEMWNALRAQSPSFASHTSEATAALFTERGFAQLSVSDPKALSEFYGLSIRAALQIVNISHARDPLAESGVGEVYDMPYGGYIQRMATTTVKPTNPRYTNLQNGQTVDRWTVRKPVTFERFWRQNFDYQSFITNQPLDEKQIFVSEYGMAEYIAGILQGLENGWIIQRYTNKLACIDAGLKDPNRRPTQTIETGAADFTVTEDAKKFLNCVLRVIANMKSVAQTRAYNAAGFADVQDISRLKLLVRAGYTADMRVYTLSGTFQPQDLDLGIDVVEVENFGGITYQTTSGGVLYPVYDKKIGDQIGWSETQGAETAQYKDGDPEIVAVDPHADTQAILMDRGWMFESIQNAYRVLPTGLNEAGLHENYWASAPNNSINFDRLYTFVEFKHSAAA